MKVSEKMDFAVNKKSLRNNPDIYSLGRIVYILDVTLKRVLAAIEELQISVNKENPSFHYVLKADYLRLKEFFDTFSSTYLTMDEFAKKVFYSKDYIYKLVKQGKLEPKYFCSFLYIKADQIPDFTTISEKRIFDDSVPIDSIKNLYDQGFSIKKLSEIYGLKYHTLYRYLNVKRGLDPKSPLLVYVPVFSHYLKHGYKIGQISILTGIPYKTIYSFVYKYINDLVEPKISKLEVHKEKIQTMLANGYKVVDIAILLNVNKSALYSYIRSSQLRRSIKC